MMLKRSEVAITPGLFYGERMHTILVVDDDAHIRDVIRFALEQAGMRVNEAGDGAEALERFKADLPDLVVLDILMPEMDGLEVCRQLRRHAETPIVFLTSRSDEIDRIIGLEIGGDDYVVKPFSPRELVARIHAILRRLRKRADESSSEMEKPFIRGKLLLDGHSRVTSWDGREVALTATEFSLLQTMLRHPVKAFTRDELMDLAYEHNSVVNDRTIDSHVRGVRSKFAAIDGEHVIETVHGVGYKLGSCR